MHQPSEKCQPTVNVAGGKCSANHNVCPSVHLLLTINVELILGHTDGVTGLLDLEILAADLLGPQEFFGLEGRLKGFLEDCPCRHACRG